jgi:hypothetical protein
VTPEQQHWPQVRWRGYLKAANTVAQELAGIYPVLLAWRLALPFSLHGSIPSQDYAGLARQHGWHGTHRHPGILVRGELLLWECYFRQLAGQVEERLRKQPNPLRTELTALQLQQWFGLESRAPAEAVLEYYAKSSGIKINTHAGIRCAVLPQKSLTAPTDEQARAAESLLEQVTAAGGMTYPMLQALAQGRLHIVRWLFDTELLIISPDGEIFSRRQLAAVCRELRIAGIAPDSATVAELKVHCGLKRRAAEALRGYFIHQPLRRGRGHAEALRARA